MEFQEVLLGEGGGVRIKMELAKQFPLLVQSFIKLVPFFGGGGAPSRLVSYWRRGSSFKSKLHSTEFIGQITH